MSIRNVVRSIIEIDGNHNPSFAEVVVKCHSLGVTPPANAASLAACISSLRTEMGLNLRHRAPAPALTPTSSAPTPAVVDDRPVCEINQSVSCSVPMVDETLVLHDEILAIAEAFQARASLGQRPKGMLIGPAGTGKTSMARGIAAKLGRPFAEFYAPLARESRDWFGSKGLDSEGKPRWFESEFVRAISTEGAVVLIDELNRAPSTVLNALLPLLDHRAGVWVEEMGRQVKCAVDLIFLTTCNIGRSFSGTFQLDGALQDRFSTLLEVKFLDKDEEANLLVTRTGVDEDTAKRLATVASISRTRFYSEGNDSLSKPISTRQLLNAAANYAVAGRKKTLICDIANSYSDQGGAQSERASVLSLLVGQFGAI